jgi:hypothetical protein
VPSPLSAIRQPGAITGNARDLILFVTVFDVSYRILLESFNLHEINRELIRTRGMRRQHEDVDSARAGADGDA